MRRCALLISEARTPFWNTPRNAPRWLRSGPAPVKRNKCWPICDAFDPVHFKLDCIYYKTEWHVSCMTCALMYSSVISCLSQSECSAWSCQRLEVFHATEWWRWITLLHVPFHFFRFQLRKQWRPNTVQDLSPQEILQGSSEFRQTEISFIVISRWI